MIHSVLSWFRFLLWTQIEHCQPPLIVKWQTYHFRRLAQYALTNVTFWRHRLPKNSAPRQTFPLTIITKEDLRNSSLGERLSRQVRKDQITWRSTSGSTGTPLSFPISSFYNHTFTDKRYLAYARYRFLSWRLHQSSTQNLDLVKSQRLLHIGLVPYSTAPKHYLFIPIAEVRNQPQRVWQTIQDFSPTMLETLPSILTELIRVNRPAQIHIPIIHTTGELLAAPVRKKIEAVFCGEVFDAYGLEEMGMIGIECQQHNGLHISEESYLIEVVDQKNCLLQNGNEGRVVVTSLFGYTHPFIRYDTGDIGYLADSFCLCGINTQRLFVKGRRGGVSTIKNKAYTHIELQHAVEAIGEAILHYQWQLNKYSTRLIVIPDQDSTEYDQHLFDLINHQLQTELNLQLEQTEVTFSQTDLVRQSGKIPAIIET